MSESPTDEIRQGAKEIRKQGEQFIPQGRRARFYLATAELLERIAAEMDEYSRIEARDGVVGIVEFLGGAFQPSATWTAALEAARAFLGRSSS